MKPLSNLNNYLHISLKNYLPCLDSNSRPTIIPMCYYALLLRLSHERECAIPINKRSFIVGTNIKKWIVLLYGPIQKALVLNGPWAYTWQCNSLHPASIFPGQCEVGVISRVSLFRADSVRQLVLIPVTLDMQERPEQVLKILGQDR